MEFASGQLDSIASGAQLRLNGPNTFVADAGATGSNSALTGLDNVMGELDLENGAAVAVGGDLVDDGGIFIDTNGNEGASHLTVAGTLTNSGRLQIGNGGLSADDSVTAAAVDNSGQIQLFGNTATGHRATLDIAGAAGFGIAGTVTGHVQLFDDALVEFASGQLDAIASGGQLQLNGPNTFVADAGATGSNSALTGLDSVVGELDLDSGAVVAVNGDLVDDGGIFIDTNGNEGASHLTVAGTLTNSGRLQVGNGGLSADDSVTAAASTTAARSSLSATPPPATARRSTSPAPPASASPGR